MKLTSRLLLMGAAIWPWIATQGVASAATEKAPPQSAATDHLEQQKATEAATVIEIADVELDSARAILSRRTMHLTATPAEQWQTAVATARRHHHPEELPWMEFPAPRRLPNGLMRGDPMPAQERVALLDWTTSMTGISRDYIDVLVNHESSWDIYNRPYDRRRRCFLTTASGFGQFVRKTWDGERDNYPAAATLTLPEWRALRFDPRWSLVVTADFQLQNERAAARMLGAPLTAGEVYLLHFLGVRDGVALIRAQHEGHGEDIAASLLEGAANSNPSIFWDSPKDRTGPRTVAQVYARQTSEFQSMPFIDPTVTVPDTHEQPAPMTPLDRIDAIPKPTLC